MILRLIYWPMAKKIKSGRIQARKKLMSGDVSSLISCVKVAPDPISRCASVGSFMMPVLYFLWSSLTV